MMSYSDSFNRLLCLIDSSTLAGELTEMVETTQKPLSPDSHASLEARIESKITEYADSRISKNLVCVKPIEESVLSLLELNFTNDKMTEDTYNYLRNSPSLATDNQGDLIALINTLNSKNYSYSERIKLILNSVLDNPKYMDFVKDH